MEQKTVIFLDVDGVVNHLRGLKGDEHVFAGGFWVLIPEETKRLVKHLVETCEVYWLTTWREKANEFIAPLLDIPPLRVITDGGGSRYVDWKPNAAWPLAQRLIDEGREVYWIEDFYQIPQFVEGVHMIDTTSAGGLFPWHLPDHLLPEEMRGKKPRIELSWVPYKEALMTRHAGLTGRVGHDGAAWIATLMGGGIFQESRAETLEEAQEIVAGWVSENI